MTRRGLLIWAQPCKANLPADDLSEQTGTVGIENWLVDQAKLTPLYGDDEQIDVTNALISIFTIRVTPREPTS